MRTYGQDESGKWVTIATDANGFNDAVYLTTLVQNLKLAPQESGQEHLPDPTDGRARERCHAPNLPRSPLDPLTAQPLEGRQGCNGIPVVPHALGEHEGVLESERRGLPQLGTDGMRGVAHQPYASPMPAGQRRQLALDGALERLAVLGIVEHPHDPRLRCGARFPHPAVAELRLRQRRFQQQRVPRHRRRVTRQQRPRRRLVRFVSTSRDCR